VPLKKSRPPRKAKRAVGSPLAGAPPKSASPVYPDYDATFHPADGILAEDAPGVLQPSRLAWSDDARGLFLYHGDCLEVMDTIAAKHPDGVFDLIFADPPYFLSNGGITCHAGKMVKVDKGGWDKSRGPALNHEFNTAWLERCQRLLKPHGSLFVSGTHHVIFSVGYAMQQLGLKLLNQITWQKPNPPPNLACRYFTHSTETVLWAAKNEKSKHRFNYADMKRANAGKQMKDVWTFTAPKPEEKTLGKHPTQKPLVLLERILLAASNPGDFVLDPFMGSGTTAVACARHERKFVGIEQTRIYVDLAALRLEADTIMLVARVNVFVETQNDLELFAERIDPILAMSAPGSPPHDCIFHETKFVFLSCAQVSQASVVHTTLNVTLQEAWAHAPDGKKRETTHIVRCETEILRVKSS
jgi:site-specific DNA-methyltransferase (adenine-specific)